MKQISFAWTTPALLARRKTCTRRDWKPEWAAKFAAGELVEATDRQLRFGGRRVAIIRLDRAPYLESTADMPDSDFEAEGFPYLAAIGARIGGLSPQQLWAKWREHPQPLFVVRFTVEQVLDARLGSHHDGPSPWKQPTERGGFS